MTTLEETIKQYEQRTIRIEQHIDFIRKDLKERCETPTSKVTFFGALYILKVKKEGDKRAKTITYSAAQNVLKGYRAILV